MPPEHQFSLDLDAVHSPQPAVLPELRGEIAQAWGLPLGEHVEVCFRNSERSAVSGNLELVSSPDWPWDTRQPLSLRISGFVFDSRDIDRWSLL